MSKEPGTREIAVHIVTAVHTAEVETGVGLTIDEIVTTLRASGHTDLGGAWTVLRDTRCLVDIDGVNFVDMGVARRVLGDPRYWV